jgi:3-demethylubiquinone-9 3-methyltransferase
MRCTLVSKNTICLWYDDAALEPASFYAATFANSAVGAVHHAPDDYPNEKKGPGADGGVHRDGHPAPRAQRRPEMKKIDIAVIEKARRG